MLGEPEDGSQMNLETRLQQAASRFVYPATPPLAAREILRLQGGARMSQGTGRGEGQPARRKASWRTGWAIAALAAMAVLAGLLAVTPVRARMVEWLKLGAIRLRLEPKDTPLPTGQPGSTLDLEGETSLAKAADAAGFALRLPAYPADLQEPQHVYLQRVNGTPVVIMVWMKPGAAEEVRLALYQMGDGDVFQKQLMDSVEETFVNGNWALWVEGPYLLTGADGKVEERRIVQGRTLIWSSQGLTYRLESDLPLDEARKIAESLALWSQP